MADKPIVEFYIQYYCNGGTLGEDETLMQTIPMLGDPAIINPKVKTEMGKAGSFEFDMEITSPYYNSMLQLKTILRVVYAGHTIFRGRVLTIDKKLARTRTVHCEGDLAFLLDSHQESTKEEARPEIGVLDYLRQILEQHNADMASEKHKQFVLGEVPGQYTSKTDESQRVKIPEEKAKQKFGENSFNSSMDRLESLLSDFGGFFRTRFVRERYNDRIGRWGEGNIDLNHRIVVHNDDGTFSTERSFSTNIEDQEVLLPTVINGEIVSEDDAIDYYEATGEYLGKFDTVEEAEEYAEALHERQEWYYGGRPQYVEKTYLDWYDKYYNAETNEQTIEITRNLIDLSGPTEVENLFTVVIPVGKNNSTDVYISDYWPIVDETHERVNYIEVPELATVPLYSDAELNTVYHRKEDYQNAICRFGHIWKTVDFDNADTPEKLFAYAKDWIKNSFMPEITEWSVTALDMRVLNGEVQTLLCGDRVRLVHPEVDQDIEGLTILSIEYDLYNPDKNKYTIAIPNQEINTSYGTKSKSKSGSSKLSGNDPKPKPKTDPDLERLKKNLQQQYSRKTDWKQDILLDNPLAFVSYNIDGSEKTAKEVAGDGTKIFLELYKTRNDPTKFSELVAEAKKRGVDIDDAQLLIDFTPSVKAKQTQHRRDSEAYMVDTLGLTRQEAEVLLYETAGESWLAALVDDEGNWTPYAYHGGIHLRAGAEQIRQMAIDTRALLGGTKTSEAKNVLDGAVERLTGGFLNLNGNYVEYDADNLTFNIGEDGSGDILSTTDIVDDVTGAVTQGVNLLQDGFTSLISRNPTTGKKSGTMNINGHMVEIELEEDSGGFDWTFGLFDGSTSFQEIKDNATGAINDVLGIFGDGVTIESVKNTVSGAFNSVLGLLGGGFSLESIGNAISGGLSQVLNLFSGGFSVQNIIDSLTGKNTKDVKLLDGKVEAKSEEKDKTGGGTWFNDVLDFFGIFHGNNTENDKKEFTLTSETADINGTLNGGSAGFGTGGALGGWKVVMNRPMTYTSGGNTYTVPAGSVAASDFHVEAVYDSLIAKFLAVDTLVANKVDADSIRSEIAYIHEINSDYISGQTQVSASIVRGSTIRGDRILMNVSPYPGETGNVSELKDCFKDCTVSTTASGQTRLRFRRMDNRYFDVYLPT